jgi:hypothetical protein
MGWLDAICGKWQWWRRLRGGHWERWYADFPVCADVWLHLDECLLRGGFLLRGTPTREDW